MDNFEVELQSNVLKDDGILSNEKVYTNITQALRLLIANHPKIEIQSKISMDGDIKFHVLRKNVGISYDDVVKYRDEIFSPFLVNLWGELLVRENINKFATILTNIKTESYASTVNKFEHRKFGMDLIGDKFVFAFHLSFVQKIMFEDFKQQVRKNK